MTHAGYKWITDTRVISEHLRENIRDEMSHNILMTRSAKNLPIPSTMQELRIFLTSPVVGVRILQESRKISPAFVYPILRLFSFETRLILVLF